MRVTWYAALAVALVALPAFGQDSTSNDPAFGDALIAWDTTEQVNQFVVDLQPLVSSWGHRFHTAPLIKASYVGDGSNFKNQLISSQGMSNTLLRNVGFPFSTYDYWAQPHQGINAIGNDPATPLSTAGFTGHQFAVGFAEYGTSDAGKSINNLIGGVVNYRPQEPGRLYVARIAAAVNASDETQNLAQLGFGAVDSNGNLALRVDDSGVQQPAGIDGNNYFRIDMLARNPGALNVIGDTGASDAGASTWLAHVLPLPPPDSRQRTLVTPGLVPEQLSGRPVVTGTLISEHVTPPDPTKPDLPAEYWWEGTAGTMSTTPTFLVPAAADIRGNLSFSHRLSCLPDSVGTNAALGLDATFNCTLMQLWDVDANGHILGGIGLQVPPTFTLPTAGNPTFGPVAFGHYKSQVIYRGGNGQVALGTDQQGRQVAAAVVYDTAVWPVPPATNADNNPYNAIAVARWTDCQNPEPEWTLAAWIGDDPAQTDPAYYYGTPILDGPGGSQIGTLAPLLVSGSTRKGPSMSAPLMDSVGNIYFTAVCRINGDPDYYTNGLLRAVYDPATFTYELELLFEMYQVFHGDNSNTDYEIAYMGLADSNSVDSGTTWSGNILQTAWNDMPTDNFAPADPGTLGGLTLSVDVFYDGDGDGQFGSLQDERYAALIFIGPAVLLGDANCDGVVNNFDITPFVQALANPAAYGQNYGCLANCDVNADGVVNNFDITPFVHVLTNP